MCVSEFGKVTCGFGVPDLEGEGERDTEGELTRLLLGLESLVLSDEFEEIEELNLCLKLTGRGAGVRTAPFKKIAGSVFA